jgi:hypothetical protein
LSEAVTDILVERGDQLVALSTARNRGAKISDFGFSTLVRRAEGDDPLATCVGARPEIPPHLFVKLSQQRRKPRGQNSRPRIRTPRTRFIRPLPKSSTVYPWSKSKHPGAVRRRKHWSSPATGPVGSMMVSLQHLQTQAGLKQSSPASRSRANYRFGSSSERCCKSARIRC